MAKLSTVKSIREKNIQEFLASNLHMIEPGLTLLDKEYYLRPEKGTKGFIDILAKDTRDNIVVIEIKSARTTTREALHELFKYESYLIEERLLNHEQIRLCIVSTDWEELIIPFSNAFAHSQANLEGYMCFVLTDGTITKIARVKPQKLTEGRLFNDSQLLLWLFDGEDLKAVINKIQDHFRRIKFPSYVLVTATAPTDYEEHEKNAMGLYVNSGLLSNYHSPTKFVNIAVQTIEREKLEQMVQCDERKLQKTLIEGYNSVHDIPEYYLINKALFSELWELYNSFDVFLEDGTPEKINQRLNVEYWGNVEIIRGETFADKRILSDNLLLDEITGDFSSDHTKARIEFASENRSSLKKVERSLSRYLQNNRKWRYPLQEVFEEVMESQLLYHGLFKYYDPESILRYLYLASVDEKPESLIPSANLTIHVLNTEKKEYSIIQYVGIYEKCRRSEKYTEILKKYYNNDDRVLKMSAIFDGYREDNLQISYDLGFSICLYRRIFVNPFVFIDKNKQFIVDPDFNELICTEKYNAESGSFIPIDYQGDIKGLSFPQFFKQERDFMEHLSKVLKGSEHGFII